MCVCVEGGGGLEYWECGGGGGARILGEGWKGQGGGTIADWKLTKS